jgi:alkyl sulfatase BDS1-like metallo-beta-lactamase superfamily hydrolase
MRQERGEGSLKMLNQAAEAEELSVNGGNANAPGAGNRCTIAARTRSLAGGRGVRLAMAAMVSALLSSNPAALAREKASVNAELHAYHDRFRTPRLVQVKPGIYVAHAYGLANFTFIEGRRGIIAIDTGWFAHEMSDALRDLRKITDKPISAIIYTHAHPDHTGGAGLLVQEGRDIPIYAPAGFSEPEWDRAGRQFGISLERAVSQLGLFLKDVGEDPDGGGVGPSPIMGGRQFREPTRLIETRQDIEIDGIRFTMIPAGMDVANGMMVWMGDQRILWCGDTVTGVFPILETPRYVPSRNPEKMAESFDLALALALAPEVVIPGHGRLLLDKADARDVLIANRNLSRFLIDQVDRLIDDGLGVEEIVHRIVVPERLTEHPDLQPFYHRRDWMIRGLVMKRLGWNTEMLDLVREDGVAEAQDLVGLVGREKLEQGFHLAFDSGKYRWAARLARWLMLADGAPGDRELYYAALGKVAEVTLAANERAYLLTDIAVENGKLDMNQALRSQKLAYAASLDARALIDQLRARVNPDRAKDQRISLDIETEGADAPFHLLLDDQTLLFATFPISPDFTVKLSRNTLNMLHARQIEWHDLNKLSDVFIDGDRKKFLNFLDSLE